MSIDAIEKAINAGEPTPFNAETVQAQRDRAFAEARTAEQRIAELEHFVRAIANTDRHSSDETRLEEYSEFRRQARKLMEGQ